MQQAVLFFLINHTITPKEKDNLINTFKIFDKNQNGTLSKKELITQFKKTNINISENRITKILQNFDANNNHKFDYSEFLLVFIDKEKLITEERIKRAFEYFDQNCDGIICIEEFRQVLSGNQIVEKRVWEEFVELAGGRRKGKVGYLEFRAILRDLL